MEYTILQGYKRTTLPIIQVENIYEVENHKVLKLVVSVNFKNVYNNINNKT